MNQETSRSSSSTLVRDENGTPAPAVAEQANDDSRAKLRRQLKGDLDSIVLKALRKEPSRRYVSVEQLAQDINRHLVGLPVEAAPNSLCYRARKFVGRHRVGGLAASLIVLAVLGGVAATIWEERIAAANQKQAVERFNDVRKLAHSLMFELHDSIQDLPGSTPARKLLVSRALEYLDRLTADAGGDPSLQAELADAYERVGRVQGGDFGRANLGDGQGALSSFRKMLAIRQTIAQNNPEDIRAKIAAARSYRAIADLEAVYLGDVQNALQNIQQALSISEAVSREQPGDNPAAQEYAADLEKLGDIQGGGNGSATNLADYTMALANHIRSRALVQKLARAAPDDKRLQRWLAVADYKLQNDLSEADQLNEAIADAREATAILTQFASDSNNTGAQHDLAAAYDAMAGLSRRDGDFSEALSYFRKEVKLLEPGVAADPKNAEYAVDLANARASVGYCLCKAGNCRAGLGLLRSELSDIARLDHPNANAQTRITAATIEIELGGALEEAGSYSEAVQHLGRAEGIYRAVSAGQGADIGTQLALAGIENEIAENFLKEANFTKAVAAFRQSLAVSGPLISDRRQALYAAFKSYDGLGDAKSALAEEAESSHLRLQFLKEAQGAYRQALETAKRMSNKLPVDSEGFDSPNTAKVKSQLDGCEKTLAVQRD